MSKVVKAGGGHTMNLVDDDGKQQSVKHAVPSGKARVELARIAKEADAVNDKVKTVMETAIRSGTDDQNAVVRALIESKALTLDEVLELNTESAEQVESEMLHMFAMFRIAVERRGLSQEWQDRIDDDDFMGGQDYTEVSAFVRNFRARLGV